MELCSICKCELRLPERLFEIYMTLVLQMHSPVRWWERCWRGGLAWNDWSRGGVSGGGAGGAVAGAGFPSALEQAPTFYSLGGRSAYFCC